MFVINLDELASRISECILNAWRLCCWQNWSGSIDPL